MGFNTLLLTTIFIVSFYGHGHPSPLLQEELTDEQVRTILTTPNHPQQQKIATRVTHNDFPSLSQEYRATALRILNPANLSLPVPSTPFNSSQEKSDPLKRKKYKIKK